jgi:hypothetical protein
MWLEMDSVKPLSAGLLDAFHLLIDHQLWHHFGQESSYPEFHRTCRFSAGLPICGSTAENGQSTL